MRRIDPSEGYFRRVTREHFRVHSQSSRIFIGFPIFGEIIFAEILIPKISEKKRKIRNYFRDISRIPGFSSTDNGAFAGK